MLYFFGDPALNFRKGCTTQTEYSLYNCEIEIIDNTEKSEQQELVENLVQIITVFSCKLQGKRANKAKKLVKELIEEEKADGKSHKSNVSAK